MVVGLVDGTILIHTEGRLKACFFHLLDNMLITKGQYFYRQTKIADFLHQLCAVANPDVILCAGCYNLFAEQCAAAALDAIKLGINLIYAINADIQNRCVIGVQQRDTQALCLLSRSVRSRYALNLQTLLLDTLTQLFNQVICSGTGADTYQHTILYIFRSFIARHLFLIHVIHLIIKCSNQILSCLVSLL